jgi:hypothetical protein
MRKFSGLFACIALVAIVTACAGRLGGSKSPVFNALILKGTSATTAAEVASQVRGTTSNLVMIFAPHDSAWYADVAKQTGLVLSRSRKEPQGTIGFLAVKPEGDSTLTLNVGTGRTVLVHDALYKVDKTRYIDLLGVAVDGGVSASETVHALLKYMATDVMGEAAIVLAIDAPTPVQSDSIATLMRAVLLDMRECARATRAQSAPLTRTDLLVFYGPEARLNCTDARAISGGPGMPLFARVTLP